MEINAVTRTFEENVATRGSVILIPDHKGRKTVRLQKAGRPNMEKHQPSSVQMMDPVHSGLNVLRLDFSLPPPPIPPGSNNKVAGTFNGKSALCPCI